MVKNFMSNTLEKSLNKYIPKVAGKTIKKKQQQKIISTGLNIINVIVAVFKALFYIWLFQKAFNTIGFEQTAILLLTIIMIVLKNKR